MTAKRQPLSLMSSNQGLEESVYPSPFLRT